MRSSGSTQKFRGRLFRKYVAIFVSVVAAALLVDGLFEVWFSYQASRESLIRIQSEQASAAAFKIGDFVTGIQNELGWTTQLPWTPGIIEQRHFDALRLLRQVPAITELIELDANGREQLHVSRIAMDVIASGKSYVHDPKFTVALNQGVYYGPVYFRNSSEPYMTLAVAGPSRDAGVSVAEVNLKFIWDVVSQIKVGQSGLAYVVDGNGRLIAHPDISLVLRNSDLANMPQVKAALANTGPVADNAFVGKDPQGRDVLSTHAAVAPLGWVVFVELPVQEAYAPLYAAIERTIVLLLAAIVLAFLAALFLAQKMVVPIGALRAGAERIGSGDLSGRISINTGDELETLADQFNDMAGQLQESYADLEGKVEARTLELRDRTIELARSVDELRALGEVGQTVNSTLDLETLLNTIVAKAVELSGTDAGAIYVFDETDKQFVLQATSGSDEELVAALRNQRVDLHEKALRDATERREPVQLSDLNDEPPTPVLDVILRAGFRALLVMPLLGADRVVGALVIRRRAPGVFPEHTIDVLQTFASQSVVAIQNARLFKEIEEKGHQLEVASQHKSLFLANMSHELRTPMNAILGYTELIVDGIYGDISDKVREVLERVQSNGRHLLGLINDVLDLSKIEAGQLVLSRADFSINDLVKGVFASVEPLASGKNLALAVEVPADLPAAYGDEHRITQVLLNLVGNAIKFTDAGQVTIAANLSNGAFTVAVRDTGPGISATDQEKIFEEFQQADSSSTREKGGTGLGLAISKRIVELHGGRLSVDSVPGAGATFSFTLPVRGEELKT